MDAGFEAYIVVTFEDLLCDFYSGSHALFTSLMATDELDTETLCPTGILPYLTLPYLFPSLFIPTFSLSFPYPSQDLTLLG